MSSTTVSEEPSNQGEVIEVLFLGRRWDEKAKKIYYLFLPFDLVEKYGLQKNDVDQHVRTEDVERKASWYTLKKHPNCNLGLVYSMKVIRHEDGERLKTIWIDSLNFVRQVDIKMTEVWRAQDRLVQQFKNHDSWVKKIVDNNPTNKAIEHLNWVYRQIPAGQRQAWLIAMMREISK